MQDFETFNNTDKITKQMIKNYTQRKKEKEGRESEREKNDRPISQNDNQEFFSSHLILIRIGL